MTRITGPDRVLTGACGKYAEPSGSLIPKGALERILAGVRDSDDPETAEDTGDD